MTTNPSKLVENFAGALDLILGREQGFSRMDLSQDGFWSSFAGLGLTALLDASALSVIYNTHIATGQDMTWSKPGFILASLLIALVAYGASMVAVYLCCRTPDQQQHFPRTVIAHNWASPIVSLLFMPLLLASFYARQAAHPEPAGGLWPLATILSLGVLVLVGVRLLRIGLKLSSGQAALIFLVTASVSIVISEGFEGLLGL